MLIRLENDGGRFDFFLHQKKHIHEGDNLIHKPTRRDSSEICEKRWLGPMEPLTPSPWSLECYHQLGYRYISTILHCHFCKFFPPYAFHTNVVYFVGLLIPQ